MATRPSKAILNGCLLLRQLAENPDMPRTVAGLVKVPEVAERMSPDQIEAILLAYAEAGVVQAQTTDNGVTYFLLGTFHLELLTRELTRVLGPLTKLSVVESKAQALLSLEPLIKRLSK